jgi:hypothetical protein
MRRQPVLVVVRMENPLLQLSNLRGFGDNCGKIRMEGGVAVRRFDAR